MGRGRVEVLDSLDNVVGNVGAGLVGLVTDDQPHLEWVCDRV